MDGPSQPGPLQSDGTLEAEMPSLQFFSRDQESQLLRIGLNVLQTESKLCSVQSNHVLRVPKPSAVSPQHLSRVEKKAVEHEFKNGSFDKEFSGLMGEGLSPIRVGHDPLLELQDGSLGRDDRTMALPHNLTDSDSGLYNNTVNLEQPPDLMDGITPEGHLAPSSLGVLNNRSGFIEPSRIDGPPAAISEYLDENDKTADMELPRRPQLQEGDESHRNPLDERILLLDEQ